MSKRRYKRKALPVRVGETATKERQKQHGGVVSEIAERHANGKVLMRRHRSIAECVLDAYFIREHIEEPEYKAGIRFRKAYLRSVLHIRVEDGAGNHGDYEMAFLTPTESERIVRNAYAALDMTEQSAVTNVCGLDGWVGGAYRMKALKTGLAKLAALWNIS